MPTASSCRHEVLRSLRRWLWGEWEGGKQRHDWPAGPLRLWTEARQAAGGEQALALRRPSEHVPTGCWRIGSALDNPRWAGQLGKQAHTRKVGQRRRLRAAAAAHPFLQLVQHGGGGVGWWGLQPRRLRLAARLKGAQELARRGGSCPGVAGLPCGCRRHCALLIPGQGALGRAHRDRGLPAGFLRKAAGESGNLRPSP